MVKNTEMVALEKIKWKCLGRKKCKEKVVLKRNRANNMFWFLFKNSMKKERKYFYIAVSLLKLIKFNFQHSEMCVAPSSL